MEQRKMSREEEINDSLEVCRDIYIYYEQREANGTEGQVVPIRREYQKREQEQEQRRKATHEKLYEKPFSIQPQEEPLITTLSRIKKEKTREKKEEKKEEEKKENEKKRREAAEEKKEDERKKRERAEEKKEDERKKREAAKEGTEKKEERKKKEEKDENAERVKKSEKTEKPKRKNWFKLELDPDPEFDAQETLKEELHIEEEPASEEESDFELLPEEPGKLSVILRNIVSLFFCVFIAFAAAKLLNKFIVQPTQVEGISMEDALHNGEHLLMDKLSYRFHDPERFDIVIFPFEEGVYYIKRIIGLPGETVQIREGQVYINGELLEEDVYGNTLIENAGRAKDEVVLGEDEYFLLGDNRNNSFDSRYEVVGSIHKEQFLGKAFFRLYPFHKIGALEKKSKKEADTEDTGTENNKKTK